MRVGSCAFPFSRNGTRGGESDEEGGEEEIVPDTTVSTVAGSGTAGFADGPGEQAQRRNPSCVAVDGNNIV